MTIAISGTTGITLDGQFNSASSMGFKNRIINGAMVIDQRNAGASVTPNGFTYQLDRWTYGSNLNGKVSIQQVTDAPSGFFNSVKITSLSAYTITSGDRFIYSQVIEGYNTSDIAWGTSNAQTVVLSFWAKSSLTGTFACSLNNGAGTYSYVTTYSIPTANTWTKISLTIVGSTAGAWSNGTNSGSIYVSFDLGSGSTYATSTLNTWQNAFYENATGAVALPATNGATFYITGVQLEKGSTATSFDYRPYQTELALAQRYYAKFSSLSGVYVGFGSGVSTATTSAAIVVKYPVRMRSAPTISQSNTGLYDGGSIPAVTSIGGSYYGDESVFANLNVASGLTLGRGCLWCGANNASAYIDFSSEL